MIFLFDSHQMAKLSLMDTVYITDRNMNEGTAHKTTTDVTLNILLCVTVQNVANLTHQQLLKKYILLNL